MLITLMEWFELVLYKMRLIDLSIKNLFFIDSSYIRYFL